MSLISGRTASPPAATGSGPEPVTAHTGRRLRPDSLDEVRLLGATARPGKRRAQGSFVSATRQTGWDLRALDRDPGRDSLRGAA